MTSDNFYLKTDFAGTPSTYYYSEAFIKPEIHYEYIINQHFYLSAHAGLSVIMKGGLYTKNRKEIKATDDSGNSKAKQIALQDRSPVPFFNIGVSYSLFK